MRKKIEVSVLILTVLILSVVIFSGDRHSRAFAASIASETESTKTCPYLLDLSDPKIKVEIEEIIFTDLVPGSRGNQMRIPDDKKDKYRLALVTIKITKPADQRVSLAAADLTLHYYNGDKTEVAPCEGISIFGTENNSDRPVLLSSSSGPGWVKQTCGARSTRSEVVYLDAVFSSMESDTRECWICVAQPTITQPFVCPSPAWTNN